MPFKDRTRSSGKYRVNTSTGALRMNNARFGFVWGRNRLKGMHAYRYTAFARSNPLSKIKIWPLMSSNSQPLLLAPAAFAHLNRETARHLHPAEHIAIDSSRRFFRLLRTPSRKFAAVPIAVHWDIRTHTHFAIRRSPPDAATRQNCRRSRWRHRCCGSARGRHRRSCSC